MLKFFLFMIAVGYVAQALLIGLAMLRASSAAQQLLRAAGNWRRSSALPPDQNPQRLRNAPGRAQLLRGVQDRSVLLTLNPLLFIDGRGTVIRNRNFNLHN